MRKTFLLLLLAVTTMLPVPAERVSKEQARLVAVNFLQKKNVDTRELRLQKIPAKLNLSSTSTADYAPFYVFNHEHNKGFVIVSGDDAIGNILGYADSGSFDMENAPSNLVAWMKMWDSLVQAQKCPTTSAAIYPHEKGTPIVSPLLDKIEWGQDSPFNGKCPTYTKEGKQTHYYVGCVATAMSQIMRYHSYPTQGVGSKTYTSNVGQLNANFGETTYDWENMPAWLEKDNGDAVQNNAVATLCAQLGVSVEMTYEPNGSGAFSQFVAGALKDYFAYDAGAIYLVRDYFRTQEWMDIIKTELNAHRPIYYSASNDDGQGGHAFVCDGYDSNDYVHINWGWYGRSNGYFMINNMNPDDLGIGSGGGGYNSGQEIVVGIKPRSGEQKETMWPVYGTTRLSFYTHNGLFNLMSYIENDDTKPFNGVVAAVLVKDGKIVKSLKEEILTLEQVDRKRKSLVDSKSITMRDIPSTVTNVPDGNYTMCLGVRPNNADTMMILRHPMGLPNHVDAVINNGKITAEAHTPTPHVTLLDKITSDGELYARGTGAFTLKLRNNSQDMYLNRIILKFISKDNPNKVARLSEDKAITHRVYDGSEKTIQLIVALPDTLEAGRYDVVAYEDKHENHPFDDSEAGRAVMEVLPESLTPVIRQIKDYGWIASPSYEQEVKQGENVLVTTDVRNYGSAGTAAVLLHLQNIDNEKDYVFLQDNKEYAKGGINSVKFYKRIDLEPATYKAHLTYLVDNKEKPVGGTFAECLIPVKANADLSLACEAFELPEKMQKGKRYAGSITLKALKDVNRTFFVRLRRFANSGGEIATMQSLTMKAGDIKTIKFNYTPKIDDGQYLPIVESRVSSSTFESVACYDNYYRVFNIGEDSGVEQVGNNLSIVFSNNGHTIALQGATVKQVTLYNLQGQEVCNIATPAREISLSLPSGIYIMRALTDTCDMLTRKFMIR